VKYKAPGAGAPGGVIPIRGINSDLPVRFASDGGAVPGDRIVGILTPGEAITIYPIQSAALKDFEDKPERWLDLRWDIDDATPQRFPARIALQTVNEPGTLAQVAQVIAEHDGNIVAHPHDAPVARFHLAHDRSRSLRPRYLTSIIAQLRAKDGWRTRNGECVNPAPVEPACPKFPLRLGVNVDHVATIRNARGGGAIPDPVRAAQIAIAAAGADGITAHLREDRRHIRDEDMARLKAETRRRSISKWLQRMKCLPSR
jgi:hypothetical protein